MPQCKKFGSRILLVGTQGAAQRFPPRYSGGTHPSCWLVIRRPASPDRPRYTSSTMSVSANYQIYRSAHEVQNRGAMDVSFFGPWIGAMTEANVLKILGHLNVWLVRSYFSSLSIFNSQPFWWRCIYAIQWTPLILFPLSCFVTDVATVWQFVLHHKLRVTIVI